MGVPGEPKSFGPYLVVAVSTTTQPAPYEWAVVSGGPPTEKGTTKGTCTNAARAQKAGLFRKAKGEGLFLLTRQQTPDPAVIDTMRAAAAAKGFDLSVLVPVTQAGCTYPPVGKGAPAPAS